MTSAKSARRKAAAEARPGLDAQRRAAVHLRALRLAYGIIAWSLFLLVAISALLPLLLLPRLGQRRALIRHLARAVLALCGMRLRLRGLDTLPVPSIVVANHASYLDGVVLAASLPPCFGFVIKREMSRVPLAGLLLRRIGAEFVERNNRLRGARDTRRLLRQAASGQALAFFPEGTFEAAPGLLRFHIGAFAAAARAGLPVVPIALRGTRHCLPADTIWPRPGRIDIEALPTLPAAAPEATAEHAARLRDAARTALLSALGEPDLAGPSATDDT
jgi:1-acyl-sn-glycerol-3-phosphate acyltransferase